MDLLSVGQYMAALNGTLNQIKRNRRSKDRAKEYIKYGYKRVKQGSSRKKARTGGIKQEAPILGEALEQSPAENTVDSEKEGGPPLSE